MNSLFVNGYNYNIINTVMKKGLFFLFVLFMFTPHIQGAVSTGTCGANLTWSLDYSTKTLTISGSGNMYSWSKVAGTYAPWYSSRGSIYKVILPEGLTSIGGRAFYDCSYIHSITIPQNVVNIGGDAFDGTSIDSLVWDAENFPKPVVCPILSLRDQIKDFTFGDNIDTVPSFLCEWMGNLESVTLGHNVKVIEKGAFYGCSKLSTITNNSNILTEIGRLAFSGCSSLTSFTIPYGVSIIEESTFSNCTALSQIDLHNSITSIRSNAFYGCNSLSSIIIPESVDSIYKQAFYGCAFASLTIPQTASFVDETAIDKCLSLSSIIWNSPCEPKCIHLSRQKSSFNTCIRDSIVSFALGNNMTTIPDSLFRGMKKLASISLPNSVTMIGNNAFRDCKALATINIPSKVTTIGERAFANCSALSAITIPQKVTSIGQSAFSACQALSQITIPNSVTSIGWGAFQSCSALQTAVIGNNAAIGDAAFQSCTSLINVTLGGNVPSIGASAFKGCSNLSAINIPNSVRSIGTYAFADCISLSSSITLPNVLKKIEDNTFKNCVSLQTVIFPNSIDSIMDHAFEDCAALNTINLKDGLIYIGYCAFKNCSSFGMISIPNSVQNIVKSAFEGCSSAKSLILSDDLKFLGEKAFSGCTTLEGEIVIPNGVTDIGSSIFSGSRITSLVFHESVTFVSSKALCSSLQSITCKNTSAPYVEKEYFEGVGKNVILYVPFESTDLYRNANGWKWFSTIMPIPGTEVITYYTITFNNWDGTELQKLTDVEENTIPSYTGATPIRPNDDDYTYAFSGWSPEIVAAIADATYTATYVKSPIAEGIEGIHVDGISPLKVIVDGVLYITMPDGRIYNAVGLEVK